MVSVTTAFATKPKLKTEKDSQMLNSCCAFDHIKVWICFVFNIFIYVWIMKTYTITFYIILTLFSYSLDLNMLDLSTFSIHNKTWFFCAKLKIKWKVLNKWIFDEFMFIMCVGFFIASFRYSRWKVLVWWTY